MFPSTQNVWMDRSKKVIENVRKKFTSVVHFEIIAENSRKTNIKTYSFYSVRLEEFEEIK